MEKKKLDWIISIVREEMMTANPAGGSGGFTGSGDPKTRAGFDPKMKFDGRSGIARRLPPMYRKDLIKKKK
jgi:hypothetical protein